MKPCRTEPLADQWALKSGFVLKFPSGHFQGQLFLFFLSDKETAPGQEKCFRGAPFLCWARTNKTASWRLSVATVTRKIQHGIMLHTEVLGFWVDFKRQFCCGGGETEEAGWGGIEFLNWIQCTAMIYNDIFFWSQSFVQVTPMLDKNHGQQS